MGNIDWVLYRMIEKEIHAGLYDGLFSSEIVAGKRRLTSARSLRHGCNERDSKSAESPGTSIARRIRGNEQNSQVS